MLILKFEVKQRLNKKPKLKINLNKKYENNL